MHIQVFERAQRVEVDTEESQNYRDNLSRANRDEWGKENKFTINKEEVIGP